MNFKILDCTLRDGGYLNNWDFSTEEIINIVNALEKNFVEKIELSYFSKIKNYSYLLNNLSNKSEYFFMINFSEINNIKIENNLNIRLAFKKDNIKDLKQYLKLFKKLYLQPMHINYYSKDDLFDLIDICNNNDNIEAIYIVDSFGCLLPKEIINYFNIINKNLKNSISIGFHLHNNNGLAILNAIEIIKNNFNREIIIDSTLSGIGRGGGNIKTESLLLLKNKLNITSLLEIYDSILLNKFKYIKTNIIHFLTGLYSIHQDYSKELLNHSLLEIENIFKNMNEYQKINFNPEFYK